MFIDMKTGEDISMEQFMKRLMGDDETPETDEAVNDGFRANRAYLVDRVLDNMGEETMTTEEVVQSADVLFQYIMTGKVPE